MTTINLSGKRSLSQDRGLASHKSNDLSRMSKSIQMQDEQIDKRNKTNIFIINQLPTD